MSDTRWEQLLRYRFIEIIVLWEGRLTTRQLCDTFGIGRQRIFRALKVGAHGVHGFGVAVGGDIAFHGWHPIAKENIDIARGHAFIGHRHRKHLGFGLIAQSL